MDDAGRLRKALRMEQISVRCWNQNRSWCYEATYKIDNHRFRVEIRRNAYDEQSFARVSRWDGAQWHKVCSKPISECHCKTVSYVRADVTAKDFERDELDLRLEAIAITG